MLMKYADQPYGVKELWYIIRHFVLASTHWRPGLHHTIFSVGLVEAKPHWNRIFCERFGILLSLIIPSMVHIHSFVKRGNGQ